MKLGSLFSVFNVKPFQVNILFLHPLEHQKTRHYFLGARKGNDQLGSSYSSFRRGFLINDWHSVSNTVPFAFTFDYVCVSDGCHKSSFRSCDGKALVQLRKNIRQNRNNDLQFRSRYKHIWYSQRSVSNECEVSEWCNLSLLGNNIKIVSLCNINFK